MEFFEYLSIPQVILQVIRNGFSEGGITVGQLYILMGVAGGCFLVCLVFGGLALYAMGTRADAKHPWLGFLPFANTYYAGELAGETNFFGRKMKRAGLYAMLAELVFAVLEILYLVSSVLLSNAGYYETTIIGSKSSAEIIPESVPAGLRWMVGTSEIFSALAMVANLVTIFFFCVIYNGIFRKYAPRRSYVYTVFAVLLPVRAFLLFAVRNREPVDYAAYMQERFETVMRQSGIPMGGAQPGAEDPFGDFPTPSSSPFGEFEDPPFPFPFPPFPVAPVEKDAEEAPEAPGSEAPAPEEAPPPPPAEEPREEPEEKPEEKPFVREPEEGEDEG